MKYFYGKNIDLMKLKKPVVSNLKNQVEFWKQKANELLPFTQEVSACPLCKSHDHKKCVQIYGFWWQQCKNCTHVFNSRFLPSEDLDKFYKNKKGKIKYSSTYTDPVVLE